MRDKPQPSTALFSASIEFNEQVAWQLKLQAQDSINKQWAWVCHDQKIYWAESSEEPYRPSTAIVKLIQFLFEKHIDHSFFILRNRLFTTAALTAMDTGMVKLAAKRASGEITAKDHHISLDAFDWIEVALPEIWYLKSEHIEEVKAPESIHHVYSEEDAIKLLHQMEIKISRGEVLHDHNRPIAVVFTDSAGKILASSVNSNFKNKTLHAEVRAAQEFFKTHRKPLPAKAKIYVSLKPCQMCAAMLAALSEDPKSLQVYFCQDDPGIRARNTVFDQLGIQKKISDV